MKTELEKQLDFINKCKEIIKGRSEKLGRPLSYFIHTFGCQMNAKDSEKFAGILDEIGYVETDTEDADIVLYNTCTVRENANSKVYGRLGVLKSKKKKNPDMLIGLCGCMMQEPEVLEKLKKSYPYVDIIFGTHNIYALAELLYERLTTNKRAISVLDEATEIVEDLPTNRKYSFKSGVNIMFGCNNFCSYCKVPYVRGRERSRKPQDIIKEIKKLSEEGVIEVMLLGQNVNSYGKNLEEPCSFAELLKEVEKIDKIKRIRFMTSHPKDLSNDLIMAMKNSTKICNHLHLPLQSGSSRLLKIMNRHYTKEDYLNLVAKIKKEMPEVSITTDIIVGFPGETEEDFNETIDVVKKVGFDSAFTFIYSKRTGTPAAKMPDQVPEDVVKRRFDELLKVISDISSEKCGKDVGKIMPVLVESVNDQDETLVTGRLSNNTVVHLPGNESLIGKIIDVEIDESKGFYYMAHQI